MFLKDQLFVLNYIKVRHTLLSYVKQLQCPMQGRASREDLGAARTLRLVGQKVEQK